jgi:hypothetical protein
MSIEVLYRFQDATAPFAKETRIQFGKKVWNRLSKNDHLKLAEEEQYNVSITLS